MNKFAKVIRNPWLVYNYAASKGLTDWVPDELHLKAMYRATMGKRLNLEDPVTFNEKLQWLKIHDRNPLYTTLVDKYRVKQWVADRIGEEHVTPTYAMWEHVEDIDISGLPERFVLKTNHDCGGVVICRNRAAFDLGAAKEKMAEHLKTNYFWRTREWPYKDVAPCIFAEEYLDSGESGDLHDFKILCFDGEPKFIELHKGRFSQHSQDWYDVNWNKLDIPQPGLLQSSEPDEPPVCLDKMVNLSRVLASGIPHVRVDWYVTDGRLLFGEMTLYDGAGFDGFERPGDDLMLGSMIDLNKAYDMRQL